MGVLARVRHKDHSGNVVSTHTPVGGSLQWSFKSGAIGDISYEIAFDDESLLIWRALSNQSLFFPYQTDYDLQINFENTGWQSVAQGIITSVNISDERDTVIVAGQDWAHWLEQPVWFPPYNQQFHITAFTAEDMQGNTKSFPNSLHRAAMASRAGLDKATGNGFLAVPVGNPLVYAWWPGTNGTQENFITFLINNSKTASMAGWTGGNARTDYVNITADFGGPNLDGWSQMMPYIIQFQDETNIIDHINAAAQADAPLGFDWTMQHNKTMTFFASRKSLASSPDPIWYINQTMFIGENPAQGLDWTNNGPISTHIVGLGVGSPALWWVKEDPDAQALYRDWLKLERVATVHIPQSGDALSDILTQIKQKTNGLNYINPQKDAKIQVDPTLVDPLGYAGFANQVSNTVNVVWDFEPYHQISATYWITEQNYTTNDAGDYVLDLGLQQIYN